MQKPYRLGIDLGGTNLAVMLLDTRHLQKENHGVLIQKHRSTRWQDGATAVADDIAALCRDCLQETGLSMEELPYVGIGSPGVIDSEKGLILFTSNLQFNHVPMVKLLEQRLDLPFFLANDANAAALGEALLGAARGVQHSAVITLGTGVGGGVIVDGKILSGFNGGGGELGHHVIDAHGRLCSCGRRGCWEVYSSAQGLLQTTEEVLQEYPASQLWEKTDGHGRIKDCREVFESYDRSDPAARRIIQLYMEMLGVGITNVVNLFQPEILAIGGGLGARCDLYIPYLEKMLRQQVYAYQWLQPTRLMPALLGNDAGLFGAALLQDNLLLKEELL